MARYFGETTQILSILSLSLLLKVTILKTRILHIIRLIQQNLELIIWISAMIVLMVSEPGSDHFTLCPLANAGIDFCPGCGLGHACTHALHGNIIQSIRCHPFGILALIAIFGRIFSLIFIKIKDYKLKSI